MEQKENPFTIFRRALEHFSGPLLAVWILIPSLQAGLVADDYRVISAAGGLKPHTTIGDLSHDSSSEPHSQPAQPLSDRVEHFLRKVVNSITYDLRHGAHSGPHYRPVEPLSFRVESFIWKGSLWGYHLTNILAHALSAWLVSRIAFSLFGSWQVAAIAGSLFALHPIAASAIAVITGRNAGFVCLFLLFSTWFLLRFQATNNRFFLVLSIGTFGIALLTKEQAWVFPVFLLALLLSHSDSVTFSRR
ncbi:MAG: glycosyltransferase family 39 protein, partial [Nitrososphaera sp.]|nr:glycosyltransferase family 39 protein [Nitrososphaera sp.]